MKVRVLFGLLVMLSAGPGLACGSADDPCQTDLGSYHISLPEGAGTSPPVVMYLHGRGGSGAKAISLDRLVTPLLRRGYAVIAPNGTPSGPDGTGPQSWVFYPGWQGRDERTFLKDVVSDAVKRFGVSHETVILAGFSAGGFMVNYLACAAPETFSAYAPVSGGFWRPHPESCEGPVLLFHTHGWSDKTVPLEGRKLADGQFEQGDIFAGLEIWRATNSCQSNAPTEFETTDIFLRRAWTDCAAGSALEFALFPGGHTVPEGWADMMLDWFEAL